MTNISIAKGDITKARVDAIVNAANPQMLGGGGVDGAIHAAAGPKLFEACKQVDSINGIRCPTGSARITIAGNLNAKYVIHAVGPVYAKEKDPDQVLHQTYVSVLNLAVEHGCASVAIPAISCGVYGFPHNQASHIAVRACLAYPNLEISFYLMDESIIESWTKALKTAYTY